MVSDHFVIFIYALAEGISTKKDPKQRRFNQISPPTHSTLSLAVSYLQLTVNKKMFLVSSLIFTAYLLRTRRYEIFYVLPWVALALNLMCLRYEIFYAFGCRRQIKQEDFCAEGKLCL